MNDCVIDKQRIRSCFIENFKYGYHVGRAIDFKKFANFYRLKFSEEINLSQTELEKVLLETAVKVYDKIVDEDNVLPQPLLEKIINSIDDKFNNNFLMLYYKEVFDEFKDEFVDTNVSDEMILRDYLKKKFSDKYSFEKTYLQSKENKINLKAEVNKFFDNNRKPLTIQQIKNLFVGVPEEKVRQMLNSDSNFIKVGKSTYCKIDHFVYDESDLKEALNVVENFIRIDGYALRDKVIDNLKRKTPDLISKNLMFENVGICKALSILFNKGIRFNRYIFSKEGENLVFSKILVDYFKNDNQIKMQQINSFADEFGIQITKYYLSEIQKRYVRIDEENFIKRECLSFDIEKIDDILLKYTSDFGYVSFEQICNYSQFPEIGFPWNKFLLESYVENFSKQFVLMSDSISLKEVIGFIVNKDLNIQTFYEFTEKVLQDSKIQFKSKEEILDYLFNLKLISKRSSRALDKITKI